MGDFNLSCAVTGYPFVHDTEAVIIPLFLNTLSLNTLEVSGAINLIPFYVTGKYYNYGQFIVDEDPISKLVFSNLKDYLTKEENYSDKCEFSIDEDSFTWKTFFNICNEGHFFKQGRVSFAAINKLVFDEIISNYSFYGILNGNLATYDFKSYHENIKNRFKLKTDEFSKEFKQDINNPYYNVVLNEYIRSFFMHLEFNVFLPNYKEFSEDIFSKSMMDRATEIMFYDKFLNSINRSWPESRYAGQSIKLDSFKILRNSISRLVINSQKKDFSDGEQTLINKSDLDFIEISEDTKKFFNKE